MAKFHIAFLFALLLLAAAFVIDAQLSIEEAPEAEDEGILDTLLDGARDIVDAVTGAIGLSDSKDDE
eukprot:g8931.t1